MDNKLSTILEKYNDKVPIILTRCNTCKDLPDINNKYIISKDLTLVQFMFIIKKKIKINENQTLYLLIDNKHILPSSSIIYDIYDIGINLDGSLSMINLLLLPF